MIPKTFKHIRTVTAMFAVCLALVSCKKDKDSPEPPPPSPEGRFLVSEQCSNAGSIYYLELFRVGDSLLCGNLADRFDSIPWQYGPDRSFTVPPRKGLRSRQGEPFNLEKAEGVFSPRLDSLTFSYRLAVLTGGYVIECSCTATRQ